MPPTYPSFPHRPISFRTIYWLFFISLGCAVCIAGLVNFMPNPEARDPARFAYAVTQLYSFQGLLVRPLYWVVEESLFRGFLLQVLRRRFSLPTALFLSAAAFALAHLAKGVPTMGIVFVASYYFAWLMIRTESLYAPIIAHWTLDFCALYIVFPILDANGRFVGGRVSIPFYIYLLATTVVVAGAVRLRREFRRRDLGPGLAMA